MPKEKRLHIRISEELDRKIKNHAKKDNRTVSNWVLHLIKKELEERKMKKFEIRENTLEVRGQEYTQGMTVNYEGDQEPTVLTSFDNLSDAKKELEKYECTVRDMSGYQLVTEYYIEENDYDEDGEWVSGGDIVEFAKLREE